MKFYVGSRVANAQRVSDLILQLENRGHEVTYDWTKVENLKPYGEHKDHWNGVTEKILSGISQSDFVVIIGDEGGKGMYVELGAAQLQQRISGKPHIYVIGENNDNSAFYFHRSVRRLDDEDELIREIAKLEEQNLL